MGQWMFVVNRNGRDSIVIGFQFSISFFLRYVKVTYFNCLIWGAGVSAISMYPSFTFPSFYTVANSTLSFVDYPLQSCTSLRTVSIQAQPTKASCFHFIEFVFVGGSSVTVLNWLYLAEIWFSDVPPTPSITTTPGKV